MIPRISTFPMGPLETNGYLVHMDGAAVAVDPGGAPKPMLQYAEKNGLKLTHILITHLHFDHIYGAAALAEASGAPVLAGPADAFLMETELGRGGAFGFPRVAPFSYQPLEEGELALGDIACRVLATPGHTPGSLSFHFPQAGAVIVGDLLFHRSIGRTDFPGGDLDALRRSVVEKIFTLPDDTVVYPGHGPETTVGAEKLNNPYFTEFSL
nr:hydroxyacylglutathione hydrolase [Nitratidesulfovibrio sp. HK-II]